MAPSKRPKSKTGRTTSLSLLAGIRDHDESAWHCFVDIYEPMIDKWCRRYALQPSDVADIRQNVFSKVARNISRFRKEKPSDSFRGWLWTVTSNQIKDHYRALARTPQATGGSDAHAALQRIPDVVPDDDDSDGISQVDSPTRRTLELIRVEFTDQTWQAFWAIAVDGRVPADVADDLGMTLFAVYKAKSRVRTRLRQMLEGLVDLPESD